ncbi:uncharacterized protein LOC129799049 [Phlebotomus papatasi]|uniref:uncharacterized protein LOC129799049 n=1 Tax=Phlebotomus papatasi TaxID=29031 RepID=UPI002483552C|nr:uncharacterized protein LOC129799049 [Phlebotomus papatasi]
MGNSLSIDFFLDNHDIIIPLIISIPLIFYSWKNFVDSNKDINEIKDIVTNPGPITETSYKICEKFFSKNPGFLNIPIIPHFGAIFTPFQKACFNMSTPLVRLMIEKGAMVNTSSKDNHAPFLICISAIVVRGIRDFSCLEVLTEAGCDINVIYEKTHMSALHTSLIYKRYDLFNFLLGKGIDATLKDIDGLTAHEYATGGLPREEF